MPTVASELRVGFISTADYSVLPALLKAFSGRFPDVDVELRELTGDEQIRLLGEGSLDVGILIPADEDPRFQWLPLVREPLVAVLPRSSRLARHPRALAVKALRGEPFVLFPRTLAPSLYDKIIAYLERAGFSPQVAQEARQMQTIIGLVAGGLGVSVVPACMQTLQRRDVVYKKLAPMTPQVTTMVAWRAEPSSRIVDSFLAACRQQSGLRGRGGRRPR